MPTKQEALTLEKPRLDHYQRQYKQCETALSHLFEWLLEKNPAKPAFGISPGQDSPEKDAVIGVTAKLLMNRRSPIQENSLNNPYYLHHLASLLIRTMVINHHLKNNKAYQSLLDRQNMQIQNLAQTIQEKANNTPGLSYEEKVQMNEFAKFLESHTAQSLQDKDARAEMDDLLNKMSPAVLKLLEQPAKDLLNNMDEMTKAFMEKEGPKIEKAVETQTDEALKEFNLPKPRPEAAKSDRENEEQNALEQTPADNAFQNLIGLICNLAGALQITVRSNLGNGLSLFNSMVAPHATGTSNFDSWSPEREEMKGVDPGLFNRSNALECFERMHAGLHPSHATLSNPFSTQLKPPRE